jgi:hypothetical protein
MPFDRARVPGQGQSGDDGVEVAVDAGGEGVEAGRVVLPDVAGKGVELGAVGADGLELELFGLGGVPGRRMVVEDRGPVLPMAGEQVLRLRGVGEPVPGRPG